MSEIKRFDGKVEHRADGNYVSYSSYAAIEAERDAINQENDRQAAYIERLLYVIESEGLSVPSSRQEADARLDEIRAQAVEDARRQIENQFWGIDESEGIVSATDALEIIAHGIRAAAKGDNAAAIDAVTVFSKATDAYLAEIRAQAVEELAAWARSFGNGMGIDLTPDEIVNYAANIRAAAKGDNHICKGENCTSDSFTPHSPECEKEHDKVVRGEE